MYDLCVCACACVICACVLFEGQKKVLHCLKLELLEVISYLTGVLGIELGSLGMAGIVLILETSLQP